MGKKELTIYNATWTRRYVKAVILAGGQGKRLRPITDYVPKAMVPIKNIPIIEWQIRFLQDNGISDIIVCTGYKSEMLEDLLSKMRLKGINIDISNEKKPLGTAGAIKKLDSVITEKSFFVMNGDVITDIDLKQLTRMPNSLASVPLRTKFGILDIDGDRITEFGEKKHVRNMWMNAGIYCLEKSTLDDLPSKGDLERTLFPSYAQRKMLHAVKFKDALWHSIDSFKDIEECSISLDNVM